MRLADSNILLYAVSADQAEAGKRFRAIEILADRDNLALSVQVLAEFYNQATRPSRANRLSHEEAMRFLERLADVPVQPVTVEVFRRATELCDRFRISYWDAAILAAAMMLGLRRCVLGRHEPPPGLRWTASHKPLRIKNPNRVSLHPSITGSNPQSPGSFDYPSTRRDLCRKPPFLTVRPPFDRLRMSAFPETSEIIERPCSHPALPCAVALPR